MNQIVTPHTWTRLHCSLLAPTVVQRSDAWSAFLDQPGFWRVDISFALFATWRYGGGVAIRLSFEHGHPLIMSEQWLSFSWATPPRSAREGERSLLRYKRKRMFGRGSPRDADIFARSQAVLHLSNALLVTVDRPQSVELFAYTSGDIVEAQASDAILVAHRLI